jgi:hypothetical protein
VFREQSAEENVFGRGGVGENSVDRSFTISNLYTKEERAGHVARVV